MNSSAPAVSFSLAGQQICDAAKRLATRGFTPATSGNFSMRLGNNSLAITASGRDKGNLTPDDILEVDLQGRPLTVGLTPSAETLLHCHIYRHYQQAQAVLHTHSLTQTLCSRIFARAGLVRLKNYELLKAFPGISDHQQALEVPIFPNNQDMSKLVDAIDDWLTQGKTMIGYLIAGHGMYTWGDSMAASLRHLDALEFLLHCELELRKFQR